LAALGVVWVVGVVVGWVVDRGVWLWLVSWDVVVAVDIGTWNLLEDWMEGPTAKTADRLVAARAGKTLWLVTFFGRLEARSATGAIMEPPDTKSRNQGARIPDERRASIRLRDGGSSGTARLQPTDESLSPLIRPYPCPIRPFLGFVASRRARLL
jgi:hypothetical protein